MDYEDYNIYNWRFKDDNYSSLSVVKWGLYKEQLIDPENYRWLQVHTSTHTQPHLSVMERGRRTCSHVQGRTRTFISTQRYKGVSLVIMLVVDPFQV